MTLGEKLTRLRREHNYTQERLAEILDVSRQSVSKWESGLAYPETDKLIRLGELYGCSMDYLLRDIPDEPKNEPERGGKRISLSLDFNSVAFERKSAKTVRGLPLWHVNIGIGCKARGIFAVGFMAEGIVAAGLLSVGVLSFGILALGLIAWGVLALGLVAGGSVAFGIIALGAICVGVVSIGAVSVGLFSAGAAARGRYFAIGDSARAMVAVGKSYAGGRVYQKLGFDLTPGDIEAIRGHLSQITPPWLRWAAGIIELFL